MSNRTSAVFVCLCVSYSLLGNHCSGVLQLPSEKRGNKSVDPRLGSTGRSKINLRTAEKSK